jgi:glycosyltransferase involved in cell wall biosynthesis
MFKYLFTRSAESFLLTVSDASIFLADQHRDDIFQQLPISDRESSRIIPPGTQYWYEHAALEETKQIRQEHNLATNDYLVGSVIKPRRIKRIDRAIDIVSIAEDIIGEDIYYMIVGPKSQEKYISEIKSYIQKKGMEDNIIWADEKPSKELPPYYTAFDATVMTSDQESFGRPITESYLCETPCLVTNVGGLSDQILDEETGYKIDPDEVQLGANKLVTLLQNEQLNHNFGVKGRKYVEQRFTLDSVSEEYQILINELLDLN